MCLVPGKSPPTGWLSSVTQTRKRKMNELKKVSWQWRARNINHKVDLSIELFGLPFAETEAEENARQAVARKRAQELIEKQGADGGAELESTLAYAMRSTEKYGELLRMLLYVVTVQKDGLDYAIDSLDTLRSGIGLSREAQVECYSTVKALLKNDRAECRKRMSNFRQNKKRFFKNPIKEISLN